MKTALITGVTGQDGSYLAEFLLSRGYMVHGIKRRSSSLNTSRIDHIYQDPHAKKQRFKLHYGDLTDSMSITKIIKNVKPDEIYNLGAMSHVKVSFEIPEYVAEVDALGTLRILEAVRLLGLQKSTKIYQASTSELFGGVKQNKNNKGLYDEKSPFCPKSPYGVAKLYAYWISVNYRESYHMFICNGILFNHESPRRGETFVTRKITIGISKIFAGTEDKIYLGNLDSERDFGHAKDYVKAMWMILQYKNAEDWVISSGKTTTIRELVKIAFNCLEIEIEFIGKGVNEKAIVKSCNNSKFKLKTGKEILNVDPRYFRPSEVNTLSGDANKAKSKLGWEAKIKLKDLIKEMLNHDLILFGNIKGTKL